MTIIVRDQAQANEALLHLASFRTKLSKAQNEKAEAQTTAEERFARIAEPLSRQIDEIEAELKRWYTKERKRVEADGRKSLDLDAGSIGYRASKPSLGFLKGWDPAKVVKAIRAKFDKRLAATLIKVDEKPVKDAIKRLIKSPADLKSIGCGIENNETFFIELKPEVLAKIGKAA